MPLDVVRLRDSDLSALATGDEFKAAVLLWCAAWSQVPAASLPDDERILARLAGYSLAEWRTLREMALKGWIRCDDGRLYHPVVAEKAMEAWAARTRQRDRASKRWQNRENATADAPAEPPQSHGTPEQMPRHTNGDATAMQGTGTVKGQKKVSDETLSDCPTKADLDGLWALASAKSRERSSRKDLERSVRASVRRGNTVADIHAGLESYFASREATKDGGEYAKGIHRLIENDRWREFSPAASGQASLPWQTGELAPSAEKQRFWMREWCSHADWRRGDRGPPPGEPGCRISPDIQREFGVEPAHGRAA